MCNLYKIVLILTLLLECLCESSIPFNVDIHYPLVLPTTLTTTELQTRNKHFPSLFGSSLLATKITPVQHNIFIGSPNLVSKTNSSLITGGLFKCVLEIKGSTKVSCNEINFQNVAIHKTNSIYEKEKDKSLIGFSLCLTKSNVIVCAPNYVGSNETPEGMCFILKQDSGNPILAFRYEHERLIQANRPYDSHNLFGFSLAYSESTDQLVLGMPGHIDFGGMVATVSNDFQTFPYSDVKSKVNTYQGYSVEYYPFDGTKVIVASSPKFNKFNGKVDLIHSDFGSVMYTIHGKNDSIGEYFGASLLVVDIDGKNTGDLLIGAPLYSMSYKREVGRVYLYHSLREIRRYTPQIIMAKVSRPGARFGTSLASIDLNQDEFVDIIISAPFENVFSQSTGAIYIFYGTSTGINIHSEQRIGAESLTKNFLQGFGYSLWTKTDLDNNGYDDLIVGSLISEKVIVLRTIPILEFNLTIEFDRTGINLTDTLNCKDNNPCFRVNYCIITDSISNFREELSFSANLTVTDRKIRLKETRVIVSKQSSVVRTKLNKICLENDSAFYIEVKKKNDLYDILTPIEIQMTVQLEKRQLTHFCSSCPIANSVTATKEIQFEHGCAKVQCIAKLGLKIEFKQGSNVSNGVLVQGQYNSLDANIKVNNRGESSIDTTLFISMKHLLPFSESADSSRCLLNSGQSGYKCDINKLLQTNQTEELLLRFDISQMETSQLYFEFSLNSSSKIKAGSVIQHSTEFSIVKEVSFNLIGNPFYNYSFSDQTPKLILPISLIIEKVGPSTANGVYLRFYLQTGIVEIEQSFKYRCIRVRHANYIPATTSMENTTLNLFCDQSTQACSEYECNLNRYEIGYQSNNFDLTLAFYPSKILSKIQYERVNLQIMVDILSRDTFLPNISYATARTDFVLDRQISELESESKSVIMFGGAGIGLLILIITTIILIKRGFFKRKKHEELLRVKQRMSMNPNMFADFNNKNCKEDDDDSDNSDNNG